MKLARLEFSQTAVTTWKSHDEETWQLACRVYIGRRQWRRTRQFEHAEGHLRWETLNAASRMHQHLKTPRNSTSRTFVSLSMRDSISLFALT